MRWFITPTLSLLLFPSSFYLSHVLLSFHFPFSLPPSITFSPSPSSMSCFSRSFSMFSLQSSFLSVSFPHPLCHYTVSLVILTSIPLTISVSLAISVVRQSTFQHPTHRKVNLSSIFSAQKFPHPDKVKAVTVGIYQVSPCLHMPLARRHINITKY